MTAPRRRGSLVAALAALVLAPGAFAANATTAVNVVNVTPNAAGETNNMTLSYTPPPLFGAPNTAKVTIVDSTTSFTATTGGCTGAGTSTATCTGDFSIVTVT